jgi:transposase-like protein
MTVREAKQAYRIREWAGLISQKAESGKTVKAWCRENGISTRVYYYRLRQVRESAAESRTTLDTAAETALVPSGFKTLAVAEQSTVQTLTVEVGVYSVTVNAETDAELLARVLRLLKTLC